MEPATVLHCKHFSFFSLCSKIHPAFIFVEPHLYSLIAHVFHINLRLYHDTVNLKTVWHLPANFSCGMTAPWLNLQLVKGETDLTGMTVCKTWTHSFLWVMSEMHRCCLTDRRRLHLSLRRRRYKNSILTSWRIITAIAHRAQRETLPTAPWEILPHLYTICSCA